MNPDDLRGVLTQALSPLLTLAVPAARMLGVLTMLPLFARLGLTGLLRGGVALALALPIAPALQEPLTPLIAQGGVVMTFVLIKEALVGVVIGIVAGVPFWAAQAAGEFIDQQRGGEAALLPDPSGEQGGVTGTLLLLTTSVVFLAGGGLQLIERGIYDSYGIWPAAQILPQASAEAGLRLLGVLDELMRGGLVLASPLLVAMLLAEFSLGLVSKFAPSLNVFDLSLSVKAIVQSVGMPIYAIVLVGYLRDGLAPLAHLAADLRGYAP